MLGIFCGHDNVPFGYPKATTYQHTASVDNSNRVGVNILPVYVEYVFHYGNDLQRAGVHIHRAGVYIAFDVLCGFGRLGASVDARF